MSKLNVLGAWNGGREKFFAGNSAQSFMGAGLVAMGGSCGSPDTNRELWVLRKVDGKGKQRISSFFGGI
ncbi:MAG: hypothetical protein LBT00_10450 [Spirochaetaceae bacterium]|nr:hypothetical protein [Spirochaetaceae bacterium]